MPQSTNLNKAPYFDDFDPDNSYYRVLFRPGYSIQSRELTTLQSILQNQVESLAKANFKQGSIVVPGELIVDRQYSFVKVSSFTNNLQITDYIGKKMTGNTSGIVATVVNATPLTTNDSATLFVKYESSGNSNTEETFQEGETITANSPGNPTAVVGVTGNVKPTSSSAMGYGTAVTVNDGIYFINGALVKNEQETIVLEKYNNTPSYKVGFIVSEQLTTPEEDLSLLDNAQGYSNYAAPGAHRLKVTLSLVSRPLDAPDQRDFVQLLQIKNGISTATVELSNTNGLIEDILARRTFDESGDYVVREFLLSLKESLATADNNGIYTTAQGGSADKFVAVLEPGKAYVKGYEIETTSTRYVSIDKARDTQKQENNSISTTEGSNYTVKNLLSFPDVESRSVTISGSSLTTTNAGQEVILYDRYSDTEFGDTTKNLDGTSPETDAYFVFTLSTLSATTNPVTLGGGSANWSLDGQSGTMFSYRINASQDKAYAVGKRTSGSGAYTIGNQITIGSQTATVKSAERISTPFVGIGKTKSFKFLSGTSSNGEYAKDALFKYGMFGLEYFVKIRCRNPLNFTLGKFITGQSSGARGIVEQLLPDTKELILSRVVGEFVEGETILSEQTGNSTPNNFVESEGTIREFKFENFGSAYADAADITEINIGGVNRLSDIGASSITVTNNQLRSITISDAARAAIGEFNTAPEIEIVATAGSGAKITPVMNYNNVVAYNSSFAKSYFGNTTGNPFAGDIASLESTFYVAGGVTFSAAEGDYFITADNLGSRPDLDLVDGDVISLNDDAGVNRKYIVKFACIDGATTTARIYIYGETLSAFNAKTIQRKRSKLSGVSSNTLLYPLPNKNVKTQVLDPDDTNINYTVAREFLGNFDASGRATVSVGTGEQFLGYSSNYVMSNPTSGELLDISGKVTVGSNATSITVDMSSFGAQHQNDPFKLIAPVRKTDTSPKRKILKKHVEYNVATGFNDPVIPLQYADGYKLRAVYMSGSTAPATNADVEITSRFTFDGGQRDTHYDLARLILNPGEIAPSNQLLVVYDYFDHIGGVGTGAAGSGYFTVDSYTEIDYADIPDYESSVYGKVSLRDVVDFRPRVSDFTGQNTETVLPGYSDARTVNALKFNGTGASSAPLPIGETVFESSYEFYLNRIDSLYISKSGKFVVSRGTPSLNPQTPEDLADGILLYHLNIPAYTYKLSDITTKSFDNRRYTMRDIGKLEKRIEKLEYYTVLSLLEQDTFNTQVRDEFGNDRFKNGILVDNFEGHGVGNTASTDYKCSIDTQTGVLRPSYASSQTKLEEKNTTDLQRTASGYSRNSDLITLPFTEQNTIENKYSTKTIVLNQGKSSKYSGSMKLSPDIDEWKDTSRMPELIVNENSVFDIIKNDNNVWGSLWNEWQISWTGTPTYTLNNSTNTTGTQFADDPNLVIRGKTRTRSRNGTQNRLSPYGASSVDKGQRSLSTPYVPYIRSRLVEFVAEGLEPDTQLYAFFDGIEVSAWVNPDDVTNIGTPFTGMAGYAEKGFGEKIVTDKKGNISGFFLIPNGFAPVKGKKSLDLSNTPSSFYNSSSDKKSFVAGSKSFRLTSSSTNSGNSADVSTFAEAVYTVSGLPNTSTNTIQSTRIPYINRRSTSNSDTVQRIGSSLVNINQTGLLDPLAQNFRVSGFDGGLFLSSIDLFFKNKQTPTESDTNRPVSIYLTETNGGIPTRNVIPFSEVSLPSDTELRIKINTDVPSGETINAGETITGSVSGATGTVKTALTVTTTGTRYNLILSNHNGIDFQAGEAFTVNRSPAISTTTFNIDEDSGVVDRIKVTSFGSGYDDSTTSVNVVGENGGLFGTNTTATAKLYDGRVYQIDVTNRGSNYYTAPNVTINGGDGQATAQAFLRMTNPAVKMGISTSTDGETRTRFRFKSPVYLENDATYSFVVTTSSPDYTVYSSVTGEKLLGSSVIASPQSGVGSLFKSQNSTAWSEDTSEAIKFVANRCLFTKDTTATVELRNEDLDFVVLPENPITVDNTDGSSALFGTNQKVLRVKHPNHGMKEGDFVIIKDVLGSGANNSIYGIPVTLINGFHSVSNVGLDDYCIMIDDTLWSAANVNMTGSGSGGGSSARATTNKLYQIATPQVAMLTFPSSTVSQNIKTAYGKPIDSSVTNDYTISPTYNLSPNDNYYFEESRLIASNVNEVYRNQASLLNGNKSVTYTISMSTSQDNLSPVLDVNRCNLITASTRMDNPTGDEDRFGAISQTLTVPTSSDFTVSSVSPDVVSASKFTVTGVTGGTFTNTVDSASRLTQATSGASGQIVSVGSGTLELIDITGTFVPGNPVAQSGTTANLTDVVTKTGIVIGWDSGTGNLKVKVITEDLFAVGDKIDDTNAGTSPVTSREISAVSKTNGFLFVDDNTFNSSTASKYLTKEVTLDSPATALDCKITANLFSNENVKILFKVRPDGSSENFNDIGWQYFNGTGLSDFNSSIAPDQTKSLSPSMEDMNSYLEYSYTAENLKPFSSFAIKIVFVGDNPALAPRIEDLRVIAHS